MFRFLNRFLIWAISFLLLLSFGVILITIIGETINYTFDLSSEGIKYFINCFSPFESIFALTFTVIGIYLILDQIEVSNYSKSFRSKMDWHTQLEKSIKSLQFENPFMFDHIINNSQDIYDFLSKNKFRISNKRQLKHFFKIFLNEHIKKFEQSSQGFYKNDEKYYSVETSYSIKSFKTVLFDLIEPDFHYNSFINHFDYYYMKQVYCFNKGKIKEYKPA